MLASSSPLSSYITIIGRGCQPEILRACCKINPFSAGLAWYQLAVEEDHMRRSSSWPLPSCPTAFGNAWSRCSPSQGRIVMFNLPDENPATFGGSLLEFCSSCGQAYLGVTFRPPLRSLPDSPACATFVNGKGPEFGSTFLKSCLRTSRPSTKSIGIAPSWTVPRYGLRAEAKKPAQIPRIGVNWAANTIC